MPFSVIYVSTHTYIHPYQINITLTSIQCGGYYYYHLHFSVEKTEALRDYETCPES